MISDLLSTPAPPLPFLRIAILGFGLMGGSLALALRAAGYDGEIAAMDQCGNARDRAGSGQAASTIHDTAGGAVRGADLIVMAAPAGAIPALLEEAASAGAQHALVTDLGGSKRDIVAAGERLFGPRFIGGHPMAGAESSGLQAARRDLFLGAAWALVRPDAFSLEDDPAAMEVAGMVRAVGARPLALSVAAHDGAVARVSHLPHLISFAYAAAVEAAPDSDTARALAAGSYRDMTRIARSSPALWRDLFLQNREALLNAADELQGEMTRLRQAIERGDPAELLALLETMRIGSESGGEA